ncbi:hypothetical protein K503DRAFT_786281 [Rhizopogon vinicolor AM-OR11-026]|uniref:Uncharacterized protein n=1 Tax=Rhizopogon vinicolor AM-OR11-026 TaxID=1314800 RepID=A0A1B7MMD2_9AGAM|nr:hypothetical protein K503DRAFT_786281 [Rhizopogon vinicolor AM-OR11-026]
MSSNSSTDTLIGPGYVNSYFAGACLTAVVYDWGYSQAITSGQEIELVWTRYAGVLFSIGFPVSIGNRCRVSKILDQLVGLIQQFHYDGSNSCTILWIVPTCISWVVNVMLGVITIIRLHAMYQRSGKMLIFLVVIFLVVQITCGVIIAINSSHINEGSTIGDCFTVLIKTQMFYFAALLSPELNSDSMGNLIYEGVLQIATIVQMSVLGPRLILSVREYHAKLVANSDEATGMASIAFQECIHISTGGGV